MERNYNVENAEIQCLKFAAWLMSKKVKSAVSDSDKPKLESVIHLLSNNDKFIESEWKDRKRIVGIVRNELQSIGVEKVDGYLHEYVIFSEALTPLFRY